MSKFMSETAWMRAVDLLQGDTPDPSPPLRLLGKRLRMDTSGNTFTFLDLDSGKWHEPQTCSINCAGGREPAIVKLNMAGGETIVGYIEAKAKQVDAPAPE
jgi:hypothetical protein